MTLRSIRGGKKRRVSCNGRHTGSEFARHESVQTSHWCFGARKVVKLIKQGKANDGLVLVRPWQLTTLWLIVNHLQSSIAKSVVVRWVLMGRLSMPRNGYHDLLTLPYLPTTQAGRTLIGLRRA